MCFRPQIIMPLLAFGMQNTLVKFYSQCKTEQDNHNFLSFGTVSFIIKYSLILIGYFLSKYFCFLVEGEPDS
jgi:hypothetical protein